MKTQFFRSKVRGRWQYYFQDPRNLKTRPVICPDRASDLGFTSRYLLLETFTDPTPETWRLLYIGATPCRDPDCMDCLGETDSGLCYPDAYLLFEPGKDEGELISSVYVSLAELYRRYGWEDGLHFTVEQSDTPREGT